MAIQEELKVWPFAKLKKKCIYIFHKAEILRHKETIRQLEIVKDNEAIMAAEMDVLKRQLEREKATFDKA